MMTLLSLIQQLQAAEIRVGPDAEVILQVDPEGNGYHPLFSVASDGVRTSDGEVLFTRWSASECCMDDDEYAELLKRPRCVVLAPTD